MLRPYNSTIFSVKLSSFSVCIEAYNHHHKLQPKLLKLSKTKSLILFFLLLLLCITFPETLGRCLKERENKQ